MVVMHDAPGKLVLREKYPIGGVVAGVLAIGFALVLAASSTVTLGARLGAFAVAAVLILALAPATRTQRRWELDALAGQIRRHTQPQLALRWLVSEQVRVWSLADVARVEFQHGTKTDEDGNIATFWHRLSIVMRDGTPLPLPRLAGKSGLYELQAAANPWLPWLRSPHMETAQVALQCFLNLVLERRQELRTPTLYEGDLTQSPRLQLGTAAGLAVIEAEPGHLVLRDDQTGNRDRARSQIVLGAVLCVAGLLFLRSTPGFVLQLFVLGFFVTGVRLLSTGVRALRAPDARWDFSSTAEYVTCLSKHPRWTGQAPREQVQRWPLAELVAPQLEHYQNSNGATVCRLRVPLRNGTYLPLALELTPHTGQVAAEIQRFVDRILLAGAPDRRSGDR